ncbi:HIT family protein [Candidatus Pacearchaeota archaeon]|nr:HIT family protein [Candidatus Pacearchaeota archaeon]
MNSCIFCKIIAGEVKGEVIRVSDRFIALKDAHPVAPGHVLIIPKQHFVTLFDLPDNWGSELLTFTKAVASSLLDKKLGDGFNVIMNNLEPAGQVVPHAHLHLIPRKDGDGIRFFTKV